MSLNHDFERAVGQQFTVARFLYRYLVTPGFRAVVLYRAAHACDRGGWGRLANAITSHSLKTTGCEIRPAAKIGSGLLLPHPVGVVIGCFAVIGSDCTILQNVTIGERCSNPNDHAYPTIGDRVLISAGAVVLGNVTVHEDALIGANAVVTRDVPAASVAIGIPAKVRLRRTAVELVEGIA